MQALSELYNRPIEVYKRTSLGGSSTNCPMVLGGSSTNCPMVLGGSSTNCPMVLGGSSTNFPMVLGGSSTNCPTFVQMAVLSIEDVLTRLSLAFDAPVEGEEVLCRRL